MKEKKEKNRPYEKLSLEELAKLYKSTKEKFSKTSKEFKAVVAEIKTRLQNKEITQEQAATLFGVNQSTISRWVNPPKRERTKKAVEISLEDAKKLLVQNGFAVTTHAEYEDMRKRLEEEREKAYRAGFLAGIQVGQQIKIGMTNIPINPTT
jgi:predicted XRE-type DNA-binding protein